MVNAMAHPVEIETPYEIESGKIVYKIYGGGILTSETNVSIHGEEFFAFREKGKERISDVNRTESFTGVLQSKEQQHILKSSDGKSLFLVDSANKSIKQSTLLKDENGVVDLTEMKQSGMSEVASIVCDLWTGKNRKVCLYKGIILMDEKTYLGFVYGKKAKEIDFETPLDDRTFILPDYPIKEDMIVRSKMKAVQIDPTKSLSEKILSSQNDITLEDRKYNDAVYDLTLGMYEKEKGYLEALLKAMQKSRACLQNAQTQTDVMVCTENIRKVKTSYGQENGNDIMTWTSQTTSQILEGLEEDIAVLESKMPCIKRAINIADLSSCMK